MAAAPARAAVRVLRSRDDRPERRRGHAGVPGRLRLVRRRRRVRDAAVPADALRGRAADAAARRRGARPAPARWSRFNGKSFDAPLLETRYLFHRLRVDRRAAAARRRAASGAAVLERRRAGLARGASRSCSLARDARTLAQILGVVGARVGDVPGFEIPARYFQFVRSGDARPLAAVLEHNRLDLLSLAGLTARLLHLTRTGPDGGARRARSAGARPRLRARRARRARARRASAAPSRRCRSPRWRLSTPSQDRGAARCWRSRCRRARRYEEAAVCWRQLLDDAAAVRRSGARGAARRWRSITSIALRDLTAAKAFALQSLEASTPARHGAGRAASAGAVERKMSGRSAPTDSRRRQRLNSLASGRGCWLSCLGLRRLSCGFPTSARRTSW